MSTEGRITTWAEREPEIFLARRRDDGDRRYRERRQGERRGSDRRSTDAPGGGSGPGPGR